MAKMKDEIENQRVERAREDNYFLSKDSHCSKCPRLLTRERNTLAKKCDYCLGLRSVNDLFATSYKSRKESQQTSESILEDIRVKREYNEAN